MKLSRKVSLNTASGFSIYFALVNLVIFFSFSHFRKLEFNYRLEEKAKTTGKLLLEVKEVNLEMMKILEKNNYNKLVNEIQIVLNQNFEKEYASAEYQEVLWTKSDLEVIKDKGRLEKTSGKFDILGLLYPVNGKNYYILIAAEDLWGNNKLNFIASALLISFLTSLLVIWVVNRFFIQQQMKPLDNFQKQIRDFSFSPPIDYLPEDSNIDEIRELPRSYNHLLSKVIGTFEAQREFNANASHELKTPITRMAFQTEVLINNSNLPQEVRFTMKKIHAEIHQLSDLVNSLLMLSNIENEKDMMEEFPERIDDMIFEAYDSVHRDFPEFEMSFSIRTIQDDLENNLELKCLRPLIVSCFRNLLKNACLYSVNHSARLEIEVLTEQKLLIRIYNNGSLLNEQEQQKLFEPFTRGKNSQGIQGYGLGLRMTKRILEKYNCRIQYSIKDGENCFTIEVMN